MKRNAWIFRCVAFSAIAIIYLGIGVAGIIANQDLGWWALSLGVTNGIVAVLMYNGYRDAGTIERQQRLIELLRKERRFAWKAAHYIEGRLVRDRLGAERRN